MSIDNVSAGWLVDTKSEEICGMIIPMDKHLVSRFKIGDNVKLTAECKIVEITENSVSIKWDLPPAVSF